MRKKIQEALGLKIKGREVKGIEAILLVDLQVVEHLSDVLDLILTGSTYRFIFIKDFTQNIGKKVNFLSLFRTDTLFMSRLMKQK